MSKENYKNDILKSFFHQNLADYDTEISSSINKELNRQQNQIELIAERDARGVFNVRPGITGLAQVNGVDMRTPGLLAITDAAMIETFSVTNYMKYIFLTLLGRGSGDQIRYRDGGD